METKTTHAILFPQPTGSNDGDGKATLIGGGDRLNEEMDADRIQDDSGVDWFYLSSGQDIIQGFQVGSGLNCDQDGEM